MATIINNSITAEESVLRITNPYLVVVDPVTGEPVNNAQLFFGLVGLDPELVENRKIAYNIQENGAFVPLAQPVRTSSGGVPQANGSPAALGVNGAYSYKVLDANGAQLYYAPRVEHPTLEGLSGVVIEEATPVLPGNIVSAFSTIEATTATFYASIDGAGLEFNGRLMRLNVDYEVNSTSQITLLTTYAVGTVILGRQNDPTGQTVPVGESSVPLVAFQVIADAVAADLTIGSTVTINGGLIAGDGLGGAKYLVVAGGTGSNDGENFIDMTNGNQLQLLTSNHRLQRFSETVNAISSTSGNVVVNLELGNVFELTLSETVTDIAFINENPLFASSQTVTLKVQQNGAGSHDITWAAFANVIQWAGGTAPTVTPAGNSKDIFIFTTFDAGATWFGTVAGQDFS